MSADPNMTPEQALDASIAAVSGAIARSPKEVERGVQLAELILSQLRWRGYDLVRSPQPQGDATEGSR
jgi:hypothetical protein